MSSTEKKVNPVPVPSRKKVQNKSKPFDAIKVVLVDEPRVGETVRMFIGISASDISRELVFHHPMGYSPLKGDEWVASSPDDVHLMLGRLEDPEAGELSKLRSEWIRKELVKAGLLIKSGDDFLYADKDNPTSRTEFLKLVSPKKGATTKDGKKPLTLALALEESDDSRAKIEIRIRELLAELGPESEKVYPSRFETVGGPRSDRPQIAVKWAKGLTKQQLADMLVEHGMQGPPLVPVRNKGVVPAQPSDDMSVITSGGTGQGNPNQWLFLEEGLSEHRREIRNALKVFKDKFEARHRIPLELHVTHAKRTADRRDSA